MPSSEQAHNEPTRHRQDTISMEKDLLPPTASRVRKQRSDAGSHLFTQRDVFALTWIGQQYAIRLDQLQWLLGRAPGRGARYSNWVSEGAAREVVTRWKASKWVESARIRAHEPFWIWPTRVGLRKVGLPYGYRNIAQSSLDDLGHLYAINKVRLALERDPNQWWVSERQLLQGIVREPGQRLPHRPDGQLHLATGEIIAIEVELSLKKPLELAKNLLELVHGQEYLRLRAEHGTRSARVLRPPDQSPYSQIWYFAPPTVRRQLRRERARLIQQGDFSLEEARRLVVRWYPISKEAERQREEQEEKEAFDRLDR